MIRKTFLLALVFLVSACSVWQTWQLNERYGKSDPGRFDRIIEPLADQPGATPVAGEPESMLQHGDQWQRAQAVLESRCAVCHGCYDSPCQLNLTSWEGIARGSSRTEVYATRLLATQMSRLFEDARLTSEWRAKGFFPVLNEREPSAAANLEDSLLAKMLQLKHQNPAPAGDLLSDRFAIGTEAIHQCPTREEFNTYAKGFPEGGMPYGLPALTNDEQQILLDWVQAGAPYRKPDPLAQSLQSEVDKWERFFNQDSLKGQLTSRYMYEHLYLAHLYFDQLADSASGPGEDAPARQFFRLVRSATPPGEPVNLIATRRPYDDPGVPRVYYRLTPVHSTILAKTHMPYALNDARLENWMALFLDAPYAVTTLPSYDAKTASNPFVTFSALPQVARYRFMLEEAHYTISGFIKGPVCRGQVALNVINDYFWVSFVDPRFSSISEDAGFLARTRNELRLPAEDDSAGGLLSWRKYAKMEQAYLKEKTAAIDQLARREPINLGYFWNGDGHNQNASLTIFRHQDSATVVKGLVGEKPQTAWVITYPLLERIHYLLVAGFDVYGNVGHQLSTRLYMDFLRMEGEFNFLAFLPAATRIQVRDYWYRDAREDVVDYLYGPHASIAHDTSLVFETDDPLTELYGKWQKYFSPLQPSGHDLASLANVNVNVNVNVNTGADADHTDADAVQAATLQPLNAMVGGAVTLLPEMSFLQVTDKSPGTNKMQANTSDAIWFSLLRHRSFSNIAHLFGEEKRHLPEEDRLTVLPGFIGAYPNVFLRVDKTELAEFVHRMQTLKTAADYHEFLSDFGVRRTHPEFWAVSDQAHRDYRQWQPIYSGLLDFNRLENR